MQSVAAELAKKETYVKTMKGRAMQKITPFLWFNNQAEEAMKFYMSQFAGSKVEMMEKYGKGEESPEGAVKYAKFTLAGPNLGA